MRLRLLVGLLGVALVAAALFPFTKSEAQRAPRKPSGVPAGPATAEWVGLPNYDMRLADRGEFTDSDLSSPAGRQKAAERKNAAVLARASAIDNFRAGLKPEAAANLRAVVNEMGAVKHLFVDGAALSEPQSNTPDNIARNYLRSRAALFALTSAGVASLKRTKEDNDRGTTFLDYAQTVGGYKVFEGNVQVVVNNSGEVLSVREGFLYTGQKLKLTPALTEAQGIAKAFEHAGRTVSPSFSRITARKTKTEFSSYANPLKSSYEDVLAELNVVRVGETARLAWHVYAEVGPSEWYEMLVDAHTGELLLGAGHGLHGAPGRGAAPARLLRGRHDD
jgi:hypothetical protein